MALRRSVRARSDLFPGFTEVSEIGGGRLSTVYRASEVATGRHVALKVLNRDDAPPLALESFQRESVALGALSTHPNILTLYRTFTNTDGRPVLVLELCDGALQDRMVDGQAMPAREAVVIAIKVAGALETAHRAGVLHRDVTPTSILVTEFGEPVLGGFGESRLPSLKRSTSLFDFTSVHAAPELFEGAEISEATDVYGLASTLYEIVSGRSAFRASEDETSGAVILRILRDPVVPVIAEDVPVSLSDLLIRALSKDPADRPASAGSFAWELGAVELLQGWPLTQCVVRDARPPLATGRSAFPRLPRDLVAASPAVVPPRGSTQPELRDAAAPLDVEVEAEAAPLDAQAAPLDAQAAPLDAQAAPLDAQAAPLDVEVDVEAAPLDVEAAPVMDGGAARRSALSIDDDFFERDDHQADSEIPPPRPTRPTAKAKPAQPKAAAAASDLWAGAPSEYPIRPSPTGNGDHKPSAPGAASVDVPSWITREPAPAAASAADDVDLGIGPGVLPKRQTVRSGLSAVTMDEHFLRWRSGMHWTRLDWADIRSFEPEPARVDSSGNEQYSLVAITVDGRVPLPTTRRTAADVQRLKALLDAYRLRAQSNDRWS